MISWKGLEKLFYPIRPIGNNFQDTLQDIREFVRYFPYRKYFLIDRGQVRRKEILFVELEQFLDEIINSKNSRI